MPLTADSTFISDTIFGLETNKFSKMRAMGASEDEIRLFSKTYLYRSFSLCTLVSNLISYISIIKKPTLCSDTVPKIHLNKFSIIKVFHL